METTAPIPPQRAMRIAAGSTAASPASIHDKADRGRSRRPISQAALAPLISAHALIGLVSGFGCAAGGFLCSGISGPAHALPYRTRSEENTSEHQSLIRNS